MAVTKHYMDCLGCGRRHKRTTNIRHMPNKETGIHGWHCDKWFGVQKNFEFVPERIKESRKEYEKELLQPYRQGEFSKEYRDAYPKIAKDMVKEGVITQKQHDNAKKVWYGDNK